MAKELDNGFLVLILVISIISILDMSEKSTTKE